MLAAPRRYPSRAKGANPRFVITSSMAAPSAARRVRRIEEVARGNQECRAAVRQIDKLASPAAPSGNFKDHAIAQAASSSIDFAVPRGQILRCRSTIGRLARRGSESYRPGLFPIKATGSRAHHGYGFAATELVSLRPPDMHPQSSRPFL
jgi:hypothetical protein